MSKIVKVKKSDLEINDGYLCLRGVPVDVKDDWHIVNQFEKLETLLDQAHYIKSQPDESPAPSIAGWTPSKKEWIELDLDPDDEELRAFLAGQEEAKEHIAKKLIKKEKCEALINDFVALYKWVAADEVWVKYGGDPLSRWDPALLQLTQDDLLGAVEGIVEQLDRCKPTGKSCFNKQFCVEL